MRNVSFEASPLSSLCTSSLPKRGAQDAIDETVDTAVDDKQQMADLGEDQSPQWKSSQAVFGTFKGIVDDVHFMNALLKKSLLRARYIDGTYHKWIKMEAIQVYLLFDTFIKQLLHNYQLPNQWPNTIFLNDWQKRRRSILKAKHINFLNCDFDPL